jgi:hypothetical protein
MAQPPPPDLDPPTAAFDGSMLNFCPTTTLPRVRVVAAHPSGQYLATIEPDQGGQNRKRV